MEINFEISHWKKSQALFEHVEISKESVEKLIIFRLKNILTKLNYSAHTKKWYGVTKIITDTLPVWNKVLSKYNYRIR